MPEAELDLPMPALATRTMWLILAAVLIADVLDLLDSTLTIIAAPTIAADLGGGAALIKWLGSAYALALGSLLVIGGRLGDRYGQRPTFLIGIAEFTIASLVCGLAPSPVVLIAGRLLQGASGALLIPQGIAIMTSSFPRSMLEKSFGVFGSILGLSIVIGPIVGAFIIDANFLGLGWRPMFLINIVLGTLGFVLAWKVLPRLPGDRSVVLDTLGSGLLVAAMLTFLYGLIEGSSSGWTLLTQVSVVIGVGCFIGFAVRQRTARHPLIEPSLLQNRGFTAGLVMALAFFSVVSGLGYVISLFLQQGFGRTPIETALSGVAPMAAGIIIASFTTTPLIGRFGRWLVLAGLACCLAGVVFLWAIVGALGMTMGQWSLVPPVLVIGLGMGMCIGSLFDIAVGEIARNEAGSASGSLSAVQQLASAIGAAVITSIWFGAVAASVPGAMQACLAVVAVVLIGCLGLVALLPRKAAPDAG